MADNDEDLVSNVKVEGVEESTKQLEEFGDKGAEAFGKIGAAAAAAGVTVGKGTTAIEKGTKSAGAGVDQLGEKINNLNGRPTSAQLDQIGDAIDQLGKKGVKAAKDLAQFITRIAGLATAGTAAIAGIGKLGVSIAEQVSKSTSAFEENNAAQQRAVATNLNAQQSAIQFADQQSKLNRQLANGTIDYETYSKTLQQNRDNYRDQIRVTAQLEAAQESAREETERLQKAAADRKAFSDLSDTFGGPLLSSLITLGNTALQVKNQFIQAFGPGASAFVDTLTQTLNTNAGAISSFFDSASAKISTFVSQNGPAIQKALESIGTAAAAIFDGLLNALPTLLDVFNNQIVPAFRTVAGWVDTIVQGFNNVFGTKFTTGAAVILVALTSLSGGFKLLISLSALILPAMNLLIALFSSMLGPIGLLVIAFTALYFAIDWKKFADSAVAAGTSIISFFSSIPGAIEGFFSGIWDFVKNGWDALATFVTDTWNSVIEFFQSLPDTISNIFQSVSDFIVNAFTSAFNSVRDMISGWAKTVLSYIQPIIDAIKFISGATGDSDASGAAPAFAGGGKVRGEGTSTSDSILAWLSNNEYVMRAKAVRKYGTAFMNAINSGSLDLSKFVRGFAAGGSPFSNLTPARPAFVPQAAQIVSGGRVLHLHIGDHEFRNLLIPDEDTAESLSRYVNQQRVNSVGRPPTWVTPRR